MDSRCDAFVAMRLDEPATLQVAADWRERYLPPEIAAENIRCNGCMAEAGPRCAHCAACPQWPCRFPEELYRFPGEAAQDVEGLQTMRVLARNMARVLRAGLLAGEGRPEPEERVVTSFIR